MKLEKRTTLILIIVILQLIMIYHIYVTRKEFVYIANDMKLMSQRSKASIERAELRYDYLIKKLREDK